MAAEFLRLMVIEALHRAHKLSEAERAEEGGEADSSHPISARHVEQAMPQLLLDF